MKDSLGKSVLLSIGINEYNDEKHFKNLKKCVNDATSIYNTFHSVEPLNNDKNRSILLVSNKNKQNASKGNIISSVQKLCSSVNEEDRLVLFYSGLGCIIEDEFYLVPQDI